MTSYWKRLSHNGVAVPEPYLAEGLKVKVRGREVSLPPLAEEMAYHLAKKKDTQYVLRNELHKGLRHATPRLVQGREVRGG